MWRVGSIWEDRYFKARIRRSAEQIINKPRGAKVLLGSGAECARGHPELGVTAQTNSRWRKQYGGLKTDQAKRLKDLKRENARLKKPVADPALDKAMLQEVAPGNS